MNLYLNASLAQNYTSNSQKARVMTEGWVAENLYCPLCGSPQIYHFQNNKAVADFYCPNCQEQYELKSKNGVISNRVADGAYDTFIERIQQNTSPDFLFMSYNLNDMMVHHLSFVPKFFFVPEIAEKRKPLSDNARRHGWVGCNILYDLIPDQGRIDIIKNDKEIDHDLVKEKVHRAFSMRVENVERRGCFFDVLNCVNNIKTDVFTLSEIYSYENILAEKYADNHNVQAKMRQQLQLLRDRGIIQFLGHGRYRKI